MDDPGGPYRLGLALLFLLFSAFFSGSETALFATPKHLLRKLRRGKADRMLTELTGHPETTLSTILIGNTLVNVVFTGSITALVLATSRSRQVGELVATLSSFSLLLVLGEVIPKVIAANRPIQFLNLALSPLYWWSKLLTPVSFLFAQLCYVVNMCFPTTADSLRVASEEIIEVALLEGKASGQISETAGETIRNIFGTDTTPVRRVMTKRQAIKAISADATLDEAARVILATGYSRLPVYNGDPSTLTGLIYMKDLILALPETTKLRDILRPLMSISPGESVDQVLKLLRVNRAHMAAVRSPAGELLGIITLEDLVEEIVGEIVDEHDAPMTGGDC